MKKFDVEPSEELTKAIEGGDDDEITESDIDSSSDTVDTPTPVLKGNENPPESPVNIAQLHAGPKDEKQGSSTEKTQEGEKKETPKAEPKDKEKDPEGKKSVDDYDSPIDLFLNGIKEFSKNNPKNRGFVNDLGWYSPDRDTAEQYRNNEKDGRVISSRRLSKEEFTWMQNTQAGAVDLLNKFIIDVNKRTGKEIELLDEIKGDRESSAYQSMLGGATVYEAALVGTVLAAGSAAAIGSAPLVVGSVAAGFVGSTIFDGVVNYLNKEGGLSDYARSTKAGDLPILKQVLDLTEVDEDDSDDDRLFKRLGESAIENAAMFAIGSKLLPIAGKALLPVGISAKNVAVATFKYMRGVARAKNKDVNEKLLTEMHKNQALRDVLEGKTEALETIEGAKVVKGAEDKIKKPKLTDEEYKKRNPKFKPSKASTPEVKVDAKAELDAKMKQSDFSEEDLEEIQYLNSKLFPEEIYKQSTEKGKELAEDAIEFTSDVMGSNVRSLDNSIEKLRDYKTKLLHELEPNDPKILQIEETIARLSENKAITVSGHGTSLAEHGKNIFLEKAQKVRLDAEEALTWYRNATNPKSKARYKALFDKLEKRRKQLVENAAKGIEPSPLEVFLHNAFRDNLLAEGSLLKAFDASLTNVTLESVTALVKNPIDALGTLIEGLKTATKDAAERFGTKKGLKNVKDELTGQKKRLDTTYERSSDYVKSKSKASKYLEQRLLRILKV